MGVIAKTPAQVIAGEMTYANAQSSWQDALNIASVISNRALSLGVTQQQVVGKQSEFNAYGKSLPFGANVDLAQQALDNVKQFGPTTRAMFYAMPNAVDNLPSGLNEVDAVEGGHMFFEDPHGRAIKTSAGYKAPTDLAAVRTAAAQRLEYETRLAAEEGMPTPEDRPQTIAVTQNPALMAGAPLSQVDPNISTGVPSMSALTAMPDAALAQTLQSPAAAINSPETLQAALSSLGTGIAAQRDYMPSIDVEKGARPGQTVMPSIDVAKGARIGGTDMARFGEEVGPIANRVTTVSIPGQINSPQALSDAMSVMGLEKGMDAQRTTMPTVDVAKTDRAIASPQSRFAGPQNVPISQADIARAFVNSTGQSQFDPSFTEGLMSASNPVVPSAGPTVSITPDMINSPETLSAALAAIGGAQPATTTTGNPLQAAVDSAVRGPTPSLSADSALQAAIDGAVRGPVPSSFSMTSNPLQAAIDAAAKAPAPSVAQNTGGLNSPDMQQVREAVERQVQEYQQASDEANAAGNKLSFERTSIPAPTVTAGGSLDVADPTAEASLPSATRTAPSVTMTPEQKSAYAEMAQAGFAAGLTNLSGNGRINKFGEYQSNITEPAQAPSMTPQEVAGYQQAAKSLRQAGVMNIGQQPPTDLSGNLPTDFDVLGTQTATPSLPALETVEIAKQPTIAAPVEDVAPVAAPATSVTKSMPAVQQRQSSAMDVWSGKAQTGVATDGSTVSRLSGNKIGRYVPEFDYTVFSQDDGATWSSPVAGNQLAPATTNSQMASIQPAVSKSLLSRLAAVLTGVAPTTASPTDAGPSMGLDGGMSVGRDGPAGAPGGWGPGGSIGSSGPAGGYGSTKGIDPNGTR